ncbi:Wzz/FepE/Etk N-terminal domain-containing protein [Acetomicrobium sp.]|uniref:GumC family protein n=1 Tax=Acetomicrobium sp. TaxID=1872099 RepID=UPI001BD0CA00|nr:Wzz/FepE/Etk N-terminal domain-containing protein [Acetomicrobium sp.]
MVDEYNQNKKDQLSEPGEHGPVEVPPSNAYEEDEIDLLDLALVLAKHKRLIIGIAFVACLVALILGFIMTPIYRAETRIVPPQLLTGQMQTGGLLSLPPGLRSKFGGTSTPADLITGIIKSRTMLDRIIDKFHLMDYYEAEYRQNARRALSDATNASVDTNSGLITITVEDKDPALAADIANAFVNELQDLLQNLAITQVSQQRLFLENQLKQAHHNLIQAEEEFQRYQAQSGLLNVDVQTKALMDAIARIQAQIAAKEVELKAARTFATAQNPEMKRLQAELAGLKKELKNLEAKAGRDNPNLIPAFEEIPKAGMEYARRLRDFKFQETLYQTLLQQYQAAIMAEASEGMVVQVVDPAIPPELKIKPRRKHMLIVAGFLGLFVGIFAAFIKEFIDNSSKNPESADKMALLKSYLRRI